MRGWQRFFISQFLCSQFIHIPLILFRVAQGQSLSQHALGKRQGTPWTGLSQCMFIQDLIIYCKCIPDSNMLQFIPPVLFFFTSNSNTFEIVIITEYSCHYFWSDRLVFNPDDNRLKYSICHYDKRLLCCGSSVNDWVRDIAENVRLPLIHLFFTQKEAPVISMLVQGHQKHRS